MKEIEVKAKLTNPELVLKKLEQLNITLSQPISQKDQIFLKKGVTYPVGRGKVATRIREQDAKFIFNMKISQENELDNLERETVIENPKQMQDILENIGFYEAVQVKKIRKKAKYNDMEICIDEVEQLGSFIEVEKLSEGDSLQIQEQLFTLLESLGVTKEDQVIKGYDTLMWEYLKTKELDQQT